MKTAYYKTYKLKSDFEKCKAENGNIDDFEKYPIYRAIIFDEKRIEAISKLCIGLNIIPIEHGQWIVELPKIGRMKYRILSQSNFINMFQEYNASGILGCGKGSERFAKGKI